MYPHNIKLILQIFLSNHPLPVEIHSPLQKCQLKKENAHVLYCLIKISILFNPLCALILFQTSVCQFCFRFFGCWYYDFNYRLGLRFPSKSSNVLTQHHLGWQTHSDKPPNEKIKDTTTSKQIKHTSHQSQWTQYIITVAAIQLGSRPFQHWSWEILRI